jgi:hypothetical protein
LITERDLEEAIAECQGVVKPTSNTCIKLASYLTIKDHMFGPKEREVEMKSISPVTLDIIEYDSGSEFSQRIYGRKISDVLPMIDELMETLQVMNPRLYNSVMDKL